MVFPFISCLGPLGRPQPPTSRYRGRQRLGKLACLASNQAGASWLLVVGIVPQAAIGKWVAIAMRFQALIVTIIIMACATSVSPNAATACW